MKRLFLPLVCLALMAAPSFAQDDTESYSSTTGSNLAQEIPSDLQAHDDPEDNAD